ncbi:MAG: isochorismatase family protein [Myxococcota bacterium]
MPDSPELAELLTPGRVAVLTMELQRGVAGDLSVMAPLVAAVAEARVVEHTAALLDAARARDISVVHCRAAFRPDRSGSYANVPMVNRLLENPDHLTVDTPPAELIPALGPAPGDLDSLRLHGMSPFHGTSLDPLLRSAGVDTVIATGVSLNVGIPGLVIEALNHGYHVVLPTDCVVGHPVDYGEAVLQNTLARITHQTRSDVIVEHWKT